MGVGGMDGLNKKEKKKREWAHGHGQQYGNCDGGGGGGGRGHRWDKWWWDKKKKRSTNQ